MKRKPDTTVNSTWKTRLRAAAKWMFYGVIVLVLALQFDTWPPFARGLGIAIGFCLFALHQLGNTLHEANQKIEATQKEVERVRQLLERAIAGPPEGGRRY